MTCVASAGELRDGRLPGRAAGGVPAVQVGRLSVHVGVRTQRDRAQGPAAADVQGRGGGARGRRPVVGRLGQTSRRGPAAAAPVRAHPVRGQRLPAQGAVQDRVVRAEPLAAGLGRQAAHGPAYGRGPRRRRRRVVRVPVPRRRAPVPARPAGVQRRGQLPRRRPGRRVAGNVRTVEAATVGRADVRRGGRRARARGRGRAVGRRAVRRRHRGHRRLRRHTVRGQRVLQQAPRPLPVRVQLSRDGRRRLFDGKSWRSR